MTFHDELTHLSSLIDQYLENYFHQMNSEVPEINLHQSMKYSVMAGGKRIRPVLALSVAKMLSLPVEEVIPFAAALEFIHTYSLIHDDLPAMDDDDYRRGKLTNHKVYGEAMAILAGDALLNEALELLMRTSLGAGNKMKEALEASLIVAGAAGKSGMIAGQVIDMESEEKTVSAHILNEMHRKKTGALLKASILAPAALAHASEETKLALSRYADGIGISFQIKDDILDAESTSADLGKPTGSDVKNHKATFVTLYGLDKAKEMLREKTDNAINALSPFGEKAWFLKEIAFYIAERKN